MMRQSVKLFDKQFAVAPMMDWTDRYCRLFHRQLTKYAWLYSEMVTANAVIYGNREKLIGFSPNEHPVALQLGGSDAKILAQAAHIAEEFGYREINLNVGCPSDRVQHGCFGAALMATPELVGDCVAAMKDAVRIPVSVKCRLGIDNQRPEEALYKLAACVYEAKADALWVHARKAWLAGLNPKENRILPPLNYDLVYQLKRDMPNLFIGINGGITNLEACLEHLSHMDGVMLGRAAYQTPALLAQVDKQIYHQPNKGKNMSLCQHVEALFPHIEADLKRGVRLHQYSRHMLGLFHGQPGARRFRQILSSQATKPKAGIEVLENALAALDFEADSGKTDAA